MASTIGTRRIRNVILATLIQAVGIGAYVHFFSGPRAETPGVEFASSGVTGLKPEWERALAETDDQGLSRLRATLQTTRGNIRFRFFPLDAPRTAKRIATLVSEGFYNGLLFHRVEPGFVIQGGDPTGTGSGGSGQNLAAEFNSRKHVLGAVAMARGEDPDSADSQFYISLGNHPQLDGRYTVFGQVVEGAEVLTQIQAGDRMTAILLEVE
jgi:cyclophilin family peptidyl-prolyl cis-trans isomerase